ncbi:Transposon Ty3-G Gag-Pol polyprotein [Labeo rohita]|uniref:Transposon Ty3-G Gag-Pol polyprotein n=1 Tax=Labeo rohita TaxID=84645 RepID=A0ABQ8LYJ2_LABRO|nr:Transposon Ty3-G Gag-Pol polyprotein [Labeo rohita]
MRVFHGKCVRLKSPVLTVYQVNRYNYCKPFTYCAFTPPPARASKWPEVIHFQCEPAASSGEKRRGAFWTVWASGRVEIEPDAPAPAPAPAQSSSDRCCLFMSGIAESHVQMSSAQDQNACLLCGRFKYKTKRSIVRASTNLSTALLAERPERILTLSPAAEPVKKKQRGRGSQRSELGELTSAQPPRASPSPQREGSPVLFTRPDLCPSAAASDMVSFGGSEDDMLDSMSLAASDAEELSGSINDPAPPAIRRHQRSQVQNWHGRRALPRSDQSCGRAGIGVVSSGGAPTQPPRRVVPAGRRQALASGPLRSSLRSTRNSPDPGAPPTQRACVPRLPPPSHKGYEKLPPLDESVAAHLCPPTAIGWKTKASHPSKPCRTTSALAGRAYTSAGQAASALHSMAILQVFQAKLLAQSDKSALDPATLTELRSATDLALRATKATAQAIGRSMASLVVLERHLWLTLTEIKDADKVPFLDAPISPTGLFGPSVEGFAERFSAAQKSSQAMRHFLPKRSSSTAASGRPKSAPPQQPVKPASTTPSAAAAAAQPAKAEPRLRSRSARRYPFPKRERKRRGQSLALAGPPPKRPLLNLQAPRSMPGAEGEAWQAIPGVSDWVLGIVKRGYSLQFARRPPRFSGVVPTVVMSRDAHVLRSEVMILLEKGAIEVVHPAQSDSGFYSRYFLVPKKDGTLRPILDLRRLNQALMRRPFKMLTLKQILSHVRSGDWFLSLDLKDAYFHIQIAPPSQAILEIRLRGSGLSIHGPALRLLVPGSPHVYKVHGRGSRPPETEGNPHPQLPRRLARSGPVGGRTVVSQDPSPQPLRVPRTQGQFAQEYVAPQPENIVSGSNFRFNSAEGYGCARASSVNTAISGFVQGQSPLPPQAVSENARSYGLGIPSAGIGLTTYATPSALVETTSSASCMASRPSACQCGPSLCESPGPLEGPAMVQKGRALGFGLQKEGSHNGCLQQGLGGVVRWQPSLRPMVKGRGGISHQLLGNAGSMSRPLRLPARSEGTPRTGPLRQHDCGVLHKSPGGSLLQTPLHSGEGSSGMGSVQPGFIESGSRAGQTEPGRGYAITKQCPLGRVDASPADGSENLGGLWQGRGRPLCLKRQLSLPNIFFERERCVGPRLAQPPPVCFSPDVFDSSNTQTSQGTTSQAPPGGPALEDSAMVPGAMSAALRSPLADPLETRPSLSGERGHLASPAQSMGLTPVVFEREPENLSEGVLNTISQARAPSTRRLYAFKWSVFSTWCSTQLLDKGRSPSTLKVYVAAIAASHAPIAGQSIGRNNLVVRFLKGSRRMNPSRPHTIPTWDLSTVLRALKSSPFEPLSDADLKTLTLKSALLLALVSVKRIGDLQALSISPSCLEFGPGDSKVILKPRHGYVPKVPSTPFRAQVVTLSALPSSEGDQELSLLCPVRALRMYVERSAPFRKSDQLFVCFGGRNKGQPVTKQRLSRWIVDAISLAYSSLGLECPVGVRAHSTRGVASSWAWSSGVSMAEICAAAGWALPSTFTRFYSLDIPALQAGILSA